MKLPATLKSIATLAGALLLAAALGASPAAAQQNVNVSIGNKEAPGGSSVKVPVRVSDFNNIGSVSLKISYDPQVISFQGGTSAQTSDIISGASANFNANIPSEGTLNINSIDSDALDIGNGVLLYITPSNFAGGTTTDIAFRGGSEVSDDNANVIDGASFLDGAVGEDLPAVSVERVTDASSGNTVSVSLSATQDLTNVGSVTFRVAFNTNVLTFNQIVDNSNLNLSAGANGGVVEIQGFNSGGTAPGANFAELEFSFSGGRSDLVITPVNEVTNSSNNAILAELNGGLVTDETGVSVMEGGDDGLGQSFSATPGQDSQPVGVFRLQPNSTGATLTSLTFASNASNVTGANQVALWSSSDGSFSTSGDTELATKDLSGSSGFPSTVTFSGLSEAVSTDEYYFVTVSIASGGGGQVSPVVKSDADLGLNGGVIDMVNGTEQASFTDLQLSSGASTLPVELTSFEGERVQTGDGPAVKLTWSTASETGSAKFQVQRKAETGWTTIGSRRAAGTTTEAQTYRFTDANLPFEADALTYRLRQVDVDGAAHYSAPITVARGDVASMQLLGTAPNPVRNRAVVRFAVPEKAAGTAELALYDLMGRKVRSVSVSATEGRHEQSVDVSDLASGTYILRLNAEGAAPTSRKMTVVR